MFTALQDSLDDSTNSQRAETEKNNGDNTEGGEDVEDSRSENSDEDIDAENLEDTTDDSWSEDPNESDSGVDTDMYVI